MAPTADFGFPDFQAFPPTNAFHQDGMPHVPTNASSIYPTSSCDGSPQPGMSPQSGDKRKSDSMTDESRSSLPYDDPSRMAAEEDKRRRNTAASARFRVKKKQREAALERSAKDMTDKVSALEGRINQLETENKWLKNLITEKNENKDDIATLWKKYSQETGDRKTAERKDGVGTKA